jgi:hypothetical protein
MFEGSLSHRISVDGDLTVWRCLQSGANKSTSNLIKGTSIACEFSEVW